ncbi:hypothetical protein Salat_2153200 [Sesamum alatum]|uniref:Uncharacterized protein n=1 Tax=Sesamum alatum TaxID=300844 RepID=A0AAE1Y1R0_9LAMI|nr:hypothetical protein Salat_2153200 [Sesamum alatum]
MQYPPSDLGPDRPTLARGAHLCLEPGGPSLTSSRHRCEQRTTRAHQLEALPRAGLCPRPWELGRTTLPRVGLPPAQGAGASSWGGPRRITPARGTASSWALPAPMSVGADHLSSRTASSWALRAQVSRPGLCSA